MNDIAPFRIEIPQADLDDLRDRLTRTRFANALPGVGATYGVEVDQIQRLVAYWLDGYDWRAWEAKLNEYPQFTTTIDRQNIHFLHVKSPEPNAFPLVLTHGWPMSVVEYLDMIGPLTDPRAHGLDPEIAFDLVIPHTPGFGFSGPTTETGWDAARVGRAWAELMRRLDRVPVRRPRGPDPRRGRARDADLLVPLRRPGGARCVDRGGAAEAGVPRLVLGEPGCVRQAPVPGPAERRARHRGLAGGPARVELPAVRRRGEPTTVPIGLAAFANDFKSMRTFAERDHKNIVSWHEYEVGSHYAAHDAPDVLVADIREFFAALRD